MLVRDVQGKLTIVSRNDCATELTYNEKIYNIRLQYTDKYRTCFTSKVKYSYEQNANKSITTLNNKQSALESLDEE